MTHAATLSAPVAGPDVGRASSARRAAPGSIGRVLIENLLDGGFKGDLHFVNPHHRRVLGKRCFASLRDDRQAGRARADRRAVRGGARRCSTTARARASRRRCCFRRRPSTQSEARRWERDVHGDGAQAAHPAARAACVRRDPHRHRAQRDDGRGRRASGTPRADRAIGRGLHGDAQFRGAARHRLLHGRGAGRRRTTSASASCSTRCCATRAPTASCSTSSPSAMRAGSCRRCARRRGPSRSSCCARGRSKERAHVEPDAPPPDAVFDAAMKRAGTVRVMTYTQLFAAARILAMGRIPRGDRLAIVTNGRGPGTLAADSAAGPRRSARRAHAGNARRRSRGSCPTHMPRVESGQRARRRAAERCLPRPSRRRCPIPTSMRCSRSTSTAR